MSLRYVCSGDEHCTDAVLCAVAQAAAAEGIALAGTLQPATAANPGEKCHIVLQLLPGGALRDVSFPMADDLPGCRLDTDALERAVIEVDRALPDAQGLIANKFGKQEAAGRGLVATIGEAFGRGLPVLVGVSPQYRDAFLVFADGAAQEIAADPAQIMDWLRQAVTRPEVGANG